MIIVNDGSTEPETLRILASIQSQWPDHSIRILHQSNQGVSNARNHGIRSSRFPSFVPLDADNRLDPEALIRALRYLDEHLETGVVYGDKRVFGEMDFYSLVPQVDAFSMLEHHHLDTCALIRKEVWEKIGGYAEDMPYNTLEDWVFWLRAAALGFQFYKQPGRFFFYRHRAASKLRKMHAQPTVRLATTQYLWQEKNHCMEALLQQGRLSRKQAVVLRNDWQRAGFFYALKAKNGSAIRQWLPGFIRAWDANAWRQIWRKFHRVYAAFPATDPGFPANMNQDEKEFLLRELSRVRTYLEFGAGDSTEMALQVPGLEKIRTVESDPAFMESWLAQHPEVKDQVEHNRFQVRVPDLGPVREWSIPTDRRFRSQWPDYVKAGWEGGFQPELVLVDGRFRVACCLEALLSQPTSVRLLIHDFPFRPQYHILLPFFQIENAVDRLYQLEPRPDADLGLARRILDRFLYLPEDKSAEFKIRHRLPALVLGWVRSVATRFSA